jgi:hypothetical protein
MNIESFERSDEIWHVLSCESMMEIVASDCYFKDVLESYPLKEINILISGFVLEFVHNYELSKEEFLSLTHHDFRRLTWREQQNLSIWKALFAVQNLVQKTRLRFAQDMLRQLPSFCVIRASRNRMGKSLERCHSKFVVRALEGFVTDLNTIKQTVKRLEHLRDCYGLC